MIGRNDPCPCGSGKKAKKCTCPSVGMGEWEADMLAFFASCDGWVPFPTQEELFMAFPPHPQCEYCPNKSELNPLMDSECPGCG